MNVRILKKFSYLTLIATFLLVGCLSSEVSTHSDAIKPSSRFSDAYPSEIRIISKLLNGYRKQGSLSTLTDDPERYAKNIISWQMEHGGFGLHDASFYHTPWDGVQKRSEWVSKGQELGNYDDYATVAEVRFLAQVYAQTEDSALKAAIQVSIERCLQFIFTSQYDNGGWPQVYPKRHKRLYSNNVTLNDNAMIRTMVLLSDMLANIAPFDTDIVANSTKEKMYPRLESAVGYLLKAQIKNNNELTIWSSQYNPETYEPEPARSYELVSKSGNASVGVLAYFMNWPEQTSEVIAAVSAGIAWYDSNKVENLVLRKGEFSERLGAELWYRFYEVESNVPFFAGRDGIKKYDLAQVEDERRKGYSWAGNYASGILRAAPRYFDALEPQ